jgi:sulfatase maturation enzyme AslB (radical SAM superfamily)
MGMVTTVTTNGTIMDKKMIQEMENTIDVVALGLDGPPSLHNKIRGYIFPLNSWSLAEIMV